ncbi:hypothetical protein ACFQ7J_29925 [Streptomyces sp. NPDC056501]|uniref:hypothetical protein n=1 Tax=Streptomyces sp. NPDC056501 TaxID=3345841 RepID=UPI0036A86636
MPDASSPWPRGSAPPRSSAAARPRAALDITGRTVLDDDYEPAGVAVVTLGEL